MSSLPPSTTPTVLYVEEINTIIQNFAMIIAIKYLFIRLCWWIINELMSKIVPCKQNNE